MVIFSLAATLVFGSLHRAQKSPPVDQGGFAFGPLVKSSGLKVLLTENIYMQG
jgi:hypothetical protein